MKKSLSVLVILSITHLGLVANVFGETHRLKMQEEVLPHSMVMDTEQIYHNNGNFFLFPELELPDSRELLSHSYIEGLEQGVFTRQDEGLFLTYAHNVLLSYESLIKFRKGELTFIDVAKNFSDIALTVSAYSQLFVPWRKNFIASFPVKYHLEIEGCINLIDKIISGKWQMLDFTEVAGAYHFKHFIHAYVYENIYSEGVQSFLKRILTTEPFRFPADLHAGLVTLFPHDPTLIAKSHQCCREAIAIEGGASIYLTLLGFVDKLNEKYRQLMMEGVDLTRIFSESFNPVEAVSDKSAKIAISEVAHYIGCMAKNKDIHNHRDFWQLSGQQQFEYFVQAGFGGAIKYSLRKTLLDFFKKIGSLSYEGSDDWGNNMFKEGFNIDSLLPQLKYGSLNSIIYALENAFPPGRGASVLIPVVAEVLDEYWRGIQTDNMTHRENDEFLQNGIKVAYLLILAANTLYEAREITEICHTKVHENFNENHNSHPSDGTSSMPIRASAETSQFMNFQSPNLLSGCGVSTVLPV